MPLLFFYPQELPAIMDPSLCLDVATVSKMAAVPVASFPSSPLPLEPKEGKALVLPHCFVDTLL
jgi:hypothetical protein